ncbi:hypothetical protein Fot_22297 [Forsythia ovata]|uniref:Uncharacterized protein n=1 Tax=Forsythia ovata TaxID=205694 RepID=A0ABD1UXA5_9LAMI
MATTLVDSFWTEGWVAYSNKSSAEEKLNAAKALIARSLIFIEETEGSISDLELNQRNVATGVLNESKNDLKPLTGERDKLKKDLEVAKSDVAEFSKRFDLANQTQEIMAKVLAEANAQRESLMEMITQLEEANAQREGLLDKIYQLEEVAESLRSENFSLKENTDEAVKAGVENFRSQFEFTSDYENLQAFFVNFRAQQVLAEVKGLHLNLDLSAIELDYPTPKEVKDGAGQPPAQGQKILWTNLLLMGLRIGFSCYFVVRLILIFLFE